MVISTIWLKLNVFLTQCLQRKVIMTTLAGSVPLGADNVLLNKSLTATARNPTANQARLQKQPIKVVLRRCQPSVQA